MDILDQLRQDYATFPHQQSYFLYAEQVYFRDPLNQFRGIERYRRMINFIDRWFEQIDLTLYAIEYTAADQIETRWRLSWVAPVPWRAKMAIVGWSELRLDEAGKICSHIDYWQGSPLGVLGQVIGLVPPDAPPDQR